MRFRLSNGLKVFTLLTLPEWFELLAMARSGPGKVFITMHEEAGRTFLEDILEIDRDATHSCTIPEFDVFSTRTREMLQC